MAIISSAILFAIYTYILGITQFSAKTMKTPSLPRSATIDKVLRCIAECFNKCELITPWLIQEASKRWDGGYIDRREAFVALESLALEPGKPEYYEELQSKLTRSNRVRDVVLSKLPIQWWYDDEGCEFFPVFPIPHSVIAKRFPRLHALLFSRF